MRGMKSYKPVHKSCGHWQEVEKREEEGGLRDTPTMGQPRARVQLTMESDKGK